MLPCEICLKSLHNGSIFCMNRGVKKWFQLIVDIVDLLTAIYILPDNPGFQLVLIFFKFVNSRLLSYQLYYLHPSLMFWAVNYYFHPICRNSYNLNFRDKAPLNHERRLNRTNSGKASNFSIS